MEREFVGIDLGTTSFKGAVLNLDHGRLGPVCEFRLLLASAACANRWELDPDVVLTSVTALVRDLLRTAPNAAGLVMCSQMHSVVLDPDERGQRRDGLITWKDDAPLKRQRRAAQSSIVYSNWFRPRNGPKLAANFATAYRSARSSRRRGKGRFPPVASAALPDFVVANLCAARPVTEATNAAAHGLYHLDQRDWHKELIARLGLGGMNWPKSGQLASAWAGSSWKASGWPVSRRSAISSARSSGAGLAERELSLNISTGSQASLLDRERPAAAISSSGHTLTDNGSARLCPLPAGRSLQCSWICSRRWASPAAIRGTRSTTRWMRLVKPISKSISRSSRA